MSDVFEIYDWSGNRQFPELEFNTYMGAWDYLYNKVDNTDRLQEYRVLAKGGNYTTETYKNKDKIVKPKIVFELGTQFGRQVAYAVCPVANAIVKFTQCKYVYIDKLHLLQDTFDVIVIKKKAKKAKKASEKVGKNDK